MYGVGDLLQDIEDGSIVLVLEVASSETLSRTHKLQTIIRERRNHMASFWNNLLLF
jgi:hypothetical protein